MALLLAVAWRGQHAVRFGPPGSGGGWLLAAAVAALLTAQLLAPRVAHRVGDPAPAVRRPPSRAEWAAFAALLALGAAFRLVYFDTVPAGMNHDAAFNGMYALHILQGAPYTPYVAAAWGRETLFMYLVAPLVYWMGNEPEPIQLAATLVALATLPLFYAFARALCGPRVALVGLAFLAVSGWHGVFSRVGWRMITVPPFELLALLGLWRALESGARRDWLLTGVGTALSIYTYDAGRGVPIIIAGLFALFLLADRGRWRVRLLGGLAALLTFLIIAMPMLWYAATHLEQFKARAAHLTRQRESESGVLHNALTAAAMFNVRGNGNDFFIKEPLLEPMAASLFVCGAVGVLARPRRREHLFLLAGVPLALLPGLLAIPNGNRCITVLPFVYVVIALGLTGIADAAAGRLPAGRARALATALLLGLPVAVAAGETYREFLGPTRRDILGFSPEATAAGQYLRGFDDRYARYVVAEDWPDYTLAYLSYNGGSPLESHVVLGRQLEEIEARINRFGRNGLVFVTDLKPAGRAAHERLRRLFADHRVEDVNAPRLGGRPVAAALIVEPAVAAAGNAFDGGRGAEPGRFSQPIGVAVDPAGSVYVADRDNHRIQKFRRDGAYVTAWGTLGNEPGQFREPHDVAADADLVYVADTWNQRVQGFDHEGAPALVISGPPSLSSPRGVFVKDGRVYVAEAGGGVVRVFDRSGALRQTFGTPGGDAPGHLVEPVDVVVDSRGRVIVLNSGNNRFEQFTADAKPIGSIPIPGWTGNRLKESYLAIDTEDTLYVTDWDVGGVRRFRLDGTELSPLGSAIRQPSGVALDRDRVLVVARGDDVVRVIPLPQPPAKARRGRR